MRYFLTLSYKGTGYHGWQIQDNAPTIQKEIEKAISILLKEKTGVVGAGRTDTGVHALYYVAHFDCDNPINDSEEFCYHLNAILPDDIAVSGLQRVRDDAHARFDATEREYIYIIRNTKNPFYRETSWSHYGALNITDMNEAAAHLMDFDDFTTFAKLNSANKTNICNVTYAIWEYFEGGVKFTIRSDRFLRNMVRAITGSLVDVGRCKISPAQFREMIAAKNLSLVRTSAPAQGLFLNNVRYPDDIYSI